MKGLVKGVYLQNGEYLALGAIAEIILNWEYDESQEPEEMPEFGEWNR
jgi:hypothetical protein